MWFLSVNQAAVTIPILQWAQQILILQSREGILELRCQPRSQAPNPSGWNICLEPCQMLSPAAVSTISVCKWLSNSKCLWVEPEPKRWEEARCITIFSSQVFGLFPTVLCRHFAQQLPWVQWVDTELELSHQPVRMNSSPPCATLSTWDLWDETEGGDPFTRR